MKWYLIWFLTVQSYDGEIFNRHEQNRFMETQAECLIELEAKEFELKAQVGERQFVPVYTIPPEPDPWGFPTHKSPGRSIDYKGVVIGYSIGCNQRIPYTGGSPDYGLPKQ
jgi:hypothetical protein